MAISPPSDILSEVARAADPMRYQAAAQSLSRGTSPIAGSSFEETARAAFTRPIGSGADVYQIRNSLRNDSEFVAAAKSKKATQEFEAFVLQTFVESMLPKNSENTYGKGSAGSIWKSMMADQIGTQVARAGGIGIAEHILNVKK